MSGPKIVRVVTREERVATCSTLIAKLDAAVTALKASCTRYGDTDGLAIASSNERRTEIIGLIQQDNFDMAEVRARQEIVFIAASRDDVIDRAVRAATAAREQASRRRHAAATLAKELERKMPGKHSDLTTALKVAAGQSKPADSVDALLSRAMLALAPDTSPAEVSDTQRAIATSLQTPKNEAPAPEIRWSFPQVQDKRLAALQQQLSQIDILSGTDAAAKFTERLSQLELEAEGPTRNMKLDGLVLDVASKVEALRREDDALNSAGPLAAELGIWTNSEALNALRLGLTDAIARRDIAKIMSLATQANEALEQARQQAAAAARREAILSGLATLGYQVNESMSTSWIQDGRVVLKKSDHDQHGIELASAADAQRLQVRAVAFSAMLTPASNLAAETAWCGDFGKLQKRLAQQAGELAIEWSKPVGAVPLKVVQAPAPATLRAEEPAASWPRMRELR